MSLKSPSPPAPDIDYVGTGVPAERREFIDQLKGLSSVRDVELRRIRDQLEGGTRAKSETYFPKPAASMSDDLWEKHRALITHVNLARPALRCWSSAICGGDIVRRVVRCPEKDRIEAWVKSEDYTETISEWVDLANAYGTCVAVPRYDEETEELWTWLPDPLSTHIFTDTRDIRKVLAVAEVRENLTQFVSIWGEGVIIDGDLEWIPRNFGDWLPVEIGYGIDRRRRGEIYGLSLIRDAVEWSIRCTAVAYNIALMQRQQTRSLLVTIGDLEELQTTRENIPGAGAIDGATYALPAGFQVDWKTPDPKLQESIEVLKTFVGLQATSESIPQDVVDASLTEKSGSAEAARIRALPLLQRTRQLVPVWVSREIRFIKSHAAVLEYFRGEQTPIKKKDFDSRCEIVITNRPNVLPTSPNEVTQDVIAKMAAHLITHEDGIRTVNQYATDEDIKKLTEAAVNENLKAMEQEALKAAASANAMPEPSDVINGQADNGRSPEPA